MNFKEIKELINLIDSSSINELELEHENFKVSIRKTGSVKGHIMVQPNAEIQVCDEEPLDQTQNSNVVKEDTQLHIIKSPIVGAFYASASPDSEPYVKAGSKVKKGDVLCIIEAMKLMNEINSDVDGEIVEVLANNQELVEFGQPLFSVRVV